MPLFDTFPTVLLLRESDQNCLSYSLFSACQPPKTNVQGNVSDQVLAVSLFKPIPVVQLSKQWWQLVKWLTCCSLFSWCQPPKTDCLRYVSDQVGYDPKSKVYDPSSNFQAHSNGPTFEAIGEVADMLFTIQLVSATF